MEFEHVIMVLTGALQHTPFWVPRALLHVLKTCFLKIHFNTRTTDTYMLRQK